LFLSLGVPLLLAGDEFGHSQRGNNNAYCQDNEISWIDWNGRTPADLALTRFVARLLRARREHAAFQRDDFFTGHRLAESDRKDIAWLRPDGAEMSGGDWHARGRAICVAFGARPLFAILFNAGDEDVTFTWPDGALHGPWELVLDTALAASDETAGDRRVGTTYVVTRRSLAVLGERLT
jgi:glycogen operon protein